jgi:Predicted metal-dependent membrane protease
MSDTGDNWKGISPRGAPERPLLEAAAFLCAFYLPAYLPLGGSSPLDVLKAPYHLGLIAVDLPRILLLAYIMAAGDGFEAFGLGRLKARDFVKACFVALGALGLVACCAFLFSLAGIQNPFMAAARSGARANPALASLILASSMAVGYSEELFFRSYLMRRLGQSGLSPIWSAIASSLLFGAGHGYQGIIGLAGGFALGLFFAWRWQADRDIHAIGMGHGLYDAVVTGIAVFY